MSFAYDYSISSRLVTRCHCGQEKAPEKLSKTFLVIGLYNFFFSVGSNGDWKIINHKQEPPWKVQNCV